MSHNLYQPLTDTYGVVAQVNHPLIIAKGLPEALPGEVVIIGDQTYGQVISFAHNQTTIMVFSPTSVSIGDKIYPTGTQPAIRIDDNILGGVYNPLGEVIVKTNSIADDAPIYLVDKGPEPLTKRAVITQQLETGFSLTDLLLPIGRGQRELVIGDNKLGKSTFLFGTIARQAREENTALVWASIGKPLSEHRQALDFFQEAGVFDKVAMVVSTPQDPTSLIHLTPYTAMAIAEYFRDQGRQVLIILDDLSTHAKFYREISLLNRQFPGRDSYPGDIFYTHARLLERAGCFTHNDTSSSITCLPVAETNNSDMTDFIASNLISITDGHLLFDPTKFQHGHRPAISISLSVTRVGKQTQTKLLRDINRVLTRFINNFENTKELNHFAGELSQHSQDVLNRGHILEWFFEEGLDVIVPIPVQEIMVGMIWQNLFYQTEKQQIYHDRQCIITAYQDQPEYQQLVNQVVAVDSFDQLQQQVLAHKDELMSVCQV